MTVSVSADSSRGPSSDSSVSLLLLLVVALRIGVVGGLVGGLLRALRRRRPVVVGIVAQLVAVAQILDHLPREAGKGRLVGQRPVQPLQRAARLFVEEPPPHVGDGAGALGQRPARGPLADQIARRHRQGRLGLAADLAIPLSIGLVGDARVDVGRGAGHGARAHRLAAGGLHRLVEVARHLPLRHVAVVHAVVVVAPLQRESVGRAARQQYLVTGHAARHLRQAHRVLGHAGGIDGETDRQFGVVGQRARGFGQGLLEGIGRVVVVFLHGSAPPAQDVRKGAIAGSPHVARPAPAGARVPRRMRQRVTRGDEGRGGECFGAAMGHGTGKSPPDRGGKGGGSAKEPVAGRGRIALAQLGQRKAAARPAPVLTYLHRRSLDHRAVGLFVARASA